MRYLPLSDADRATMLRKIGVENVDALFSDVPGHLLNPDLAIDDGASELAVSRTMSALAAKNVPASSGPFFVGCGAYYHHVPASVDHLIQRSEFLTCYTPYQPEIAQGTLQTLFEFQTQVALLTGMEVANASMYDGSTGCGEAVLMAQRLTRRRKVLVAGGLHPHYRAVLENLAQFTQIELNCVAGRPGQDETAQLIAQLDDGYACVVVQSPGFYGDLTDLTPIAAAAHAKGVLVISVVTEVVSLGAIKSPGEMGADIVVAEGQSLGNGLQFGGPYVGLFATRKKYIRQMPGRVCGQTTDSKGQRGYVLTLSTREQHIRREKASSNICTNSGLCSLAFTIHLTLLGEHGLRQLAAVNHARACTLADQLAQISGVRLVTPSFFNEFTIEVAGDAQHIIDQLADRGVLGGVPVSRLEPDRDDLGQYIVVAATEMTREEDCTALVAALRESLK